MDLSLTGQFHVNIIRNGETVFRQSPFNGIVDAGKNELLDVMFRSATQTTWYCGLILNISTLSDLDTMLVHSGWTEYTDYAEAVRQTWTADAATAKNIINTTLIEFTISDVTAPTLDGMFITNDSTKGATAGKLWCTSAFSSPPTVADGDIVQVQYSLTVN
jgi:hypothetical protein